MNLQVYTIYILDPKSDDFALNEKNCHRMRGLLMIMINEEMYSTDTCNPYAPFLGSMLLILQ